MQQQTFTGSLALINATCMTAMLVVGCGGSPATAPETGSAAATLPGPLPPTVALFDLSVDPAALSAELTPVREGSAQPPQNLVFDLEVGKFLSPATLQVAGIQLTHYQDAMVQIRHRHPFPAPDLASGINARNRADLGYTGRLFLLTQASSQSFPGGINLDPWSIREPDGYADPGDLLRNATGLSHTHFPYMLLVDEAKDNREGVSNGAQRLALTRSRPAAGRGAISVPTAPAGPASTISMAGNRA